jgi:mRNA interferase RelE/StbE
LVYSIRMEKQAAKTLEKLDLETRRRVVTAIRNLATDPRSTGSKKMKSREGWRIRVGDYRVIYGIHDDQLLISITKIGHRGDVYR